MTPLENLGVNATDFRAVTFVDGETLTVQMRGTADMRVRATLGSFLRSVHHETAAQRANTVQVDLRELEFMNSSCFKSFISWFGMLRDAEPQQRYRVRIISSGKRDWQKRSLEALSCVAADLVQVQVD
jgi:hypothetical protein